MNLANKVATGIALNRSFSLSDCDDETGYVGEAYGVPTEAGSWRGPGECYSIRPIPPNAMACLIDHVRRGIIGADRMVVLVHTGGMPALFANSEEIIARP